MVKKRKYLAGVDFTIQETFFLELCCQDLTYMEIANVMGKSVRTIEGYRDNVFRKIKAKTRVGIVLWCFRNKVVEIDDCVSSE